MKLKLPNFAIRAKTTALAPLIALENRGRPCVIGDCPGGRNCSGAAHMVSKGPVPAMSRLGGGRQWRLTFCGPGGLAAGDETDP